MFDLLGIDWGSKVFGLAFGSSSSSLVLPSSKIHVANQIWLDLEEEIQKRKIQTIVLGMPTNFHGQQTEVSQKVEKFRLNLEQKFPAQKVEIIGERGSSQQAQNLINFQINSQKSQKNQQTKINNLAAAQILQWWLDKEGW